MTVTSSNPHVTFPRGNVAPLRHRRQGYARTTAFASAVALDGAVGVETTDFQIAIDARTRLPGPLTVVSTHRVNYDDKRAASATESVESANPGWTITGDPTTSPNIAAWQRRALSPTRHVWWGPDNNGQIDGEKDDAARRAGRSSPRRCTWGSAPLAISFPHRFSFEAGAWDGGVVEISADGGSDLDRHRHERLQRHDQCGHQRPHRRQPSRVRQSHGRLAELRHRHA